MTTDRPADTVRPGTPTGYRAVLAVPGTRGLYAAGVLARIPHTAAPMALLLHVTEGLARGYAAAGLVTAAVTVGVAVGSPWRGRVIDRLGLRRALLPSLVAVPALWSLAPFLPYPLLVPLAFVGGLLAVPAFTVIRQSIAVLVPPADRRAAYALDSVLVEVSFLLGPAGVILLVATAGTTAAVLATGAAALGAGLLLAWLNPPVRSSPKEGLASADGGHDRQLAGSGQRWRPRPWRVPAWLSPGVLAMYATAFGGAFVIAGTEVGVVATAQESERTVLIAVLFAIWGLASAVGGLLFGAWRGPVPPPLALLGLLALLTLPLAAADDLLLLALLLVPAGALVAPTLSSSTDGLSRRIPEAVRGEAMGWHASATTTGFSLGAPVAGLLADLAGPETVFAGVGALAGTLALAVAVTVARARPMPSELAE